MANQNYFMGLDGFVWFVGVVEDRNDPDQLGRVRVRCLGFHTENLVSLPTADLPWAHVMHPVTDPAMHGMGNTPSWLVEGSWVVGFFRDAGEKQQPIIIGSLPGVPASAADHTKGFNDPRHKDSTQLNDDGVKSYAGNPEDESDYGPYPLGALGGTGRNDTNGKFGRFSGHTVGETDTSRLGRGVVSETHGAVINRRNKRRTKIITASKPNISTVSIDLISDDTGPTWDEPNPKGIAKDAAKYLSGKYPYNHVFESESGHIIEIDDSPGGERLHREHMSGTFEEWHPKGDKVVKVIGNNYEIVAGNSNVMISGNVNITISGDCRQLIKGDYIQEIEGNYTQKIHKNHYVKVGAGKSGGNREEEIRGNHSYSIKNNVKGYIGEDIDTMIGKNESRTINGYFDGTIVGKYSIFSFEDVNITAWENMSLKTVSGIVAVSAGSNVNIRSSAEMKIKSGTNFKLQVVGAAHETFDSTYYVDYKGLNEFDHSGDWRVMKGADYYARHAAGVDYSCSTDPSRTSDDDCTNPTAPTLP